MQGHLKILTQNLSRNMEELDSEPMMVVPSPGAFSLSPKSQTESTASLSADHFSLEECPNFTACGLGCAMRVAEECVMDMPSNDHCAAMALRMLAMYTGTLRHAGIGCAVMPLVESFGFISEFGSGNTEAVWSVSPYVE